MMSVSYLFHKRAGSFPVLLFITVSAASTKPNTYLVVNTYLRSDNDWMDESLPPLSLEGVAAPLDFSHDNELATNRGTKEPLHEGEGRE